MNSLYSKTNFAISKIITERYSTSFSLGIKAFDKSLRNPIYGIYGFVRYADEIVDTFHQFNQAELLENFKIDTFKAIEQRISLNPVLDAFQYVVNTYEIDHALIYAFLKSMEMDLHKKQYDSAMYNEYIYGSAEVVGLMCLKVFCYNYNNLYESLTPYARSLGAAFQKVNFLRDIKDDYKNKGRVYFPDLNLEHPFDNTLKKAIEKDILKDFDHAYIGILQLPKSAKVGVLSAYWFYKKLFNKITSTQPERILEIGRAHV